MEIRRKLDKPDVIKNDSLIPKRAAFSRVLCEAILGAALLIGACTTNNRTINKMTNTTDAYTSSGLEGGALVDGPVVDTMPQALDTALNTKGIDAAPSAQTIDAASDTQAIDLGTDACAGSTVMPACFIRQCPCTTWYDCVPSTVMPACSDNPTIYKVYVGTDLELGSYSLYLDDIFPSYGTINVYPGSTGATITVFDSCGNIVLNTDLVNFAVTALERGGQTMVVTVNQIAPVSSSDAQWAQLSVTIPCAGDAGQ